MWKNKILVKGSMMANLLRDAMEKLHISSLESSLDEEVIDDILMAPRPRKHVKPSQEQLKQKLEDDFLQPSPTFSTCWLNRLQQ